MKRISNFTTAMMLCIVFVLIMSMTASAITPRDMMENGEVSDGSITYGDARDGVVSDVSSEMSDIGGEISEFVETVLPGADDNDMQGTDASNTTETTTRESVNNTTDSTENMTDGADMNTAKGATWGIVIAVIIVIAVVAIIFCLVKRK
ncbi:MAG: hypothetical protein IJN48_04130 [Clostridia bacterium]|nr:hypothetical protein [Clostridia bacterium]